MTVKAGQGHGTVGNARGSGYARNADDWYVEPPHAVRALFAAESFAGTIWDPACGRGTIPIVAQQCGYHAFGTDLVDRGYGVGGMDFMRHSPAPTANIVSNPPYGIIGEFVARALTLTTGRVAIFARLALLEGQERGEWFPTTPLARVLVFSWRVNCPPGQQAPPIDAPIDAWNLHSSIPYAWFIWEHGYTGEARIAFSAHPKRQTERLRLAA